MLVTTQNSFTKGELDPTLLARYDVDIYTKGARKLRNMFSLWTGAARLAPGTFFIDTIMDRTAVPPVEITDYTEVNATIFEYDADLNIIYQLIVRPDTTDTVAIDVYLDGVLEASVPAPQYSVAIINELHFAEGQDRILILHENIPTTQLVNNGTPGSWTLSNFTFSTKPVYDFTVKGGTQYRVGGFTFTPSSVSGTPTLTASGAIYTSNHIGGLFIGQGGIGRITAVASTTVCTLSMIEDFSSTAAIKGTLSSLFEVMWTSGGGAVPGPDRGWPERGIFYLNRLALGRSSVLHNVLAFSSVGVYDDFNDSLVDDTAGFTFTLNYKGNDSLQDFAGNDALIFLGASTVYATNPYTENFLTVSTFYAPPQGGEGSSPVPSISLDNQIFHCTADGSQIIRMYYDPGKAKLVSQVATLLSSHLINTVTSMSSWLPANLAAKMIFASQADGSMLMLSTLEDEVVNAWSLRTTRGAFRQVFGVKDICSVIVERQVMLDGSYVDSLDYCYYTNTTMTGFQDITDVASATVAPQEILGYVNTYLLVAEDTPYTALSFTLDTVASDDCLLTFEYLDFNGQWNFFTPSDTTNGLTGNGVISWDFSDVNGWQPRDIWNTQETIENQYWIRIRRTEATVATAPILEEIKINMQTVLHLEGLDVNTYMDCQVNTLSDAQGDVTGLTMLAGQQVYAIADGVTYGPYFVEQDGTVNIVNEFASVDIGTQFKPKLVPMPVYTPTQQGDNIYEMRYIKQVYIDYVDSLYLNVASKDVPAMNVGSYTMDSSIAPQTGFYRVNPMEYWDPRQEIVITQSVPGPMTIIGVGYNIEVT